MAAEMRDQLSESLGKNYAIERELGGGGMSRVFLARDLTLDRLVVVKVLSAESSAGVSADRFRREIQVIAKLQHPHVVPLVSAGASAGGLYYVMPFFGGETLRARLAREGPMAISDAARVLREVLDALSFAHSHGVIHRDIKPDNILLEAGHAVVADFGVAKALKESGNVTSAGIALGTPAYMAPEQASADPSADHRADLYAVGVVAYEMLTGAPPFEGSPSQLLRAHMVTAPTPVAQRRPDVPEALAQLVMRTLEKEPKDRPQDAHEMLGVLEAVSTPGAAGTQTAATTAARRPNWAVRWGIAAVLVAGTLGVWQVTRPRVIGSAQSMAIAPFSVAAGDSALIRLGQNLVTTVSANVDGVGEIRVVDPMSVLSHARRRGDLLSLADALDIARKLGASSVLHGSLTKTGAVVRADAALYQTSGGQALGRVSVTAPADSLEALTDSITWSLLRAVWSKGSAPTPNVSSITTHDQASLREFLRGERLFARGAPVEAAAAFHRAVELDTNFHFAAYRYIVARQWLALQIDTSISSRLSRHADVLPEPDRLRQRAVDALIAGGSLAGYVRDLRAITQRFPDYAPVWLAHADLVLHHAVRAGIDARESVDGFRRLTLLLPGDVEASNHLAFACAIAADLQCAREAWALYDSLVRTDSAPPANIRSQHQIQLLAFDTTGRVLDSLLRAPIRDSVNPAFTITNRLVFASLMANRPGWQRDWDRLGEHGRPSTEKIQGREGTRVTLAGRRALRGDYGGVDSAVAYESSPSFPGGPFQRYRMLRTRLLGELQGFVPPSKSTADIAEKIAEGRETTPADRVEGHWIAGISALLRDDRSEMDRHARAIATDTTFRGKVAGRSLRAIALGRRGARAAAAESLLVIERSHGDHFAFVPGVFGADRLLGAQWLVDAGRHAAADSLLFYTRGYVLSGTLEVATPTFAFAQLIRSRAAEGMGNASDAVLYAKMFLNSFDLAPASQRPLVDEAKARIARFTIADAPKARP